MSHDPELIGRQCGQPDAHAVGEEILCAACCHKCGSCGAVRDVEPTQQPTVGCVPPSAHATYY